MEDMKVYMCNLMNKIASKYSESMYRELLRKSNSADVQDERLRELWAIRLFLFSTAREAESNKLRWDESSLRFFCFQLELLENDFKQVFGESEE